ncbi:MAG: EAL domain-containing protein [Caldimicrobium sp.]
MAYYPLSVILNQKGEVLKVNSFFKKKLGFKEEELFGKSLCEILCDEACRENFLNLISQAQSKDEIFPIKLSFKKRDKDILYFEGHIKKAKGKEGIFLLYGWDVTEIYTYKRISRILMAVNKIIIKEILSEKALYKEICRVMVDEFGLRFAWVGVPDERSSEIIPLVSYGYEEGYLEEIKIVLDPERLEGKGPTATAIREGKISINPDTRTNPLYEAFREKALKRGYLSSAAIPLFTDGKLKAVLNLYSEEPFYFREEIKDLLYELKEDLEYALKRIEELSFRILLSKALENSDMWLFITDENFSIIYVNNITTTFSDYSEEELLGKPICILYEECTLDKKEKIERILKEDGSYFEVFKVRKKNGEIIYLDQKIIPVILPEKSLYVWIGRDITLEINLFETIERLENYDPLTGLLTLRGLLKRVEEFLFHGKTRAALVVLDLYEFTYINDYYGFKWGDQILQELALRLKKYLQERAFLARSSADEFVILFTEVHSEEDLALLIQKLITVIERPYLIDSELIKLKWNLGISLYPEDGKDFEELYRKANAACSQAKKVGPNVFKFYGEELTVNIKRTLEKEKLIEEALSNNLFTFFYQPYFITSNLQLSGAEALVRIVMPEGRIVFPGEFIEVLERSPLRREFELWSISEIVKKINEWNLSIGVNLYPDTFRDEKFWEEVSKHLVGLKNNIVFEITERGVMSDPETAVKIIKNLKAEFTNVKFALDDFGTGYSNMIYLKNLPVDYIKIDFSFTREIIEDVKAQGIVKSIIDIAHILHAKALAEGVETYEQYQILDIMGCDFVQGFYFERPIPEKDFKEKYLFKSGSSKAS